jgi:hypothetical protein
MCARLIRRHGVLLAVNQISSSPRRMGAGESVSLCIPAARAAEAG